MLWEYSSFALEDNEEFADALIFNYLIMGTDAHAKNYSLLHLNADHVYLAPIYDVVSILPYPDEYEDRHIKMAMKIGSEYHFRKIEQIHWEDCAKQLRLKPEDLQKRLCKMANKVIAQADNVAKQLHSEGLDHEIIDRLASLIKERAGEIQSRYSCII